jgi:outer membrane protein TolC
VAAERAAATTLNITRRQLELGQVAYLLFINAENTYEQTIISLVQARAASYADTAALFQALGGGWWNRKDVVAAANHGQGQHRFRTEMRKIRRHLS